MNVNVALDAVHPAARRADHGPRLLITLLVLVQLHGLVVEGGQLQAVGARSTLQLVADAEYLGRLRLSIHLHHSLVIVGVDWVFEERFQGQVPRHSVLVHCAQQFSAGNEERAAHTTRTRQVALRGLTIAAHIKFVSQAPMTGAHLAVLSDDPLRETNFDLADLVAGGGQFLFEGRRRHQENLKQIFKMVLVLGQLELPESFVSQPLQNVDLGRQTDHTAADLILFQPRNRLENVARIRVSE